MSSESTRATPAAPAQHDERERGALWAASVDALRRVPPVLLVLLALGLALRLMLEVSYRPASLSFADTMAYVGAAANGIFEDPARPGGYPLFLRVLHDIWPEADLVIVAQHLMGLASGILIYLTARVGELPRWVGFAAAAAVLLSLDQVYLEHAFASEALYTLLLLTALLCCARALRASDGRRLLLESRALWLLGAGLALGASAWVRGISVPMIAFLALWAALALPGSGRRRLARAALAGGPAAALVVLYMTLNQAATGSFAINNASGWATYARSAQFADCERFEPPPGTRALCEATPPDERPGPDFYTWQADSPAQELFGFPPTGNEKLGEFGRRAILAQPLDYAQVVITDIARFFVPAINSDRPYSGADYGWVSIDLRQEEIEEDVLGFAVTPYYGDTEVRVGSLAELLGGLQQFLRVHPIILLQAFLLAGFGVFFTRGRERALIVLLAGSGALAIVVSAALGTYNARYVIPFDGPIVAAGAAGIWILMRRAIARAAASGARR